MVLESLTQPNILERKTQTNATNLAKIENVPSAPAEESQAARIRRILEYKSYRLQWLNSEIGVLATKEAVGKLFDSLEEIYKDDEDHYRSSGITFIRESILPRTHFWLSFQAILYLRFAWIAGTYVNSLEGSGLQIVLAKDKRFKNVIREDFYKSDLDENYEVVWHKEKHPTEKNKSDHMARRHFGYFRDAIEKEIS